MTASTSTANRLSALPGPAVSVGLHTVSDDQDRASSIVTALDLRPDIQLLPGIDRASADILLVLATSVDEILLTRMSTFADSAANPDQRMVVVCDAVRERHLALMFTYGVVSILPRRAATPALIAQTVVSSAGGHATMPPGITRWLVDEARMMQQVMLTTHQQHVGGLTPREVEVLGLLAQGRDTNTIAERMSFSERTIKKTVQDVIARFGFANRVQAVCYAMRVGAI